MGAKCCKSRKFNQEGHRLDEIPAGARKAAVSNEQRQVNANHNTVQSTNQTISSSKLNKTSVRAEPLTSDTNQGSTKDLRKAAAEAAEARAKAAKLRGTKGGEIAKSLSKLPADGGRVEQAIEAGTTSSNQKPIIWD